MAVVVYRVYDSTAEDINDLEDYSFSVIATDEGAEYLIPEWSNIEGLNSEQIEMNVVRNYPDGEKPETAEDWADVAIDRFRSSIFVVEEPYESVEQARKSEEEFASEAFLIKQDFLAAEEENELFVEEDEEEKE